LERERKEERHRRGEGVEGELMGRKGDLEEEEADFVRKKGDMEGEVLIGARIEGESLSRTLIAVERKGEGKEGRTSSTKRMSPSTCWDSNRHTVVSTDI